MDASGPSRALRNLRSAGAVKTGLPPRMTSTSTWPASMACDELAQRRGLVGRVDVDRRQVGHCRAGVAERLVDRVRERVDRRRLVLAGDDERAAACACRSLATAATHLSASASESEPAPPRRRPSAAASARANASISRRLERRVDDPPSRRSASACSRPRTGGSCLSCSSVTRRAIGEILAA